MKLPPPLEELAERPIAFIAAHLNGVTTATAADQYLRLVRRRRALGPPAAAEPRSVCPPVPAAAPLWQALIAIGSFAAVMLFLASMTFVLYCLQASR